MLAFSAQIGLTQPQQLHLRGRASCTWHGAVPQRFPAPRAVRPPPQLAGLCGTQLDVMALRQDHRAVQGDANAVRGDGTFTLRVWRTRLVPSVRVITALLQAPSPLVLQSVPGMRTLHVGTSHCCSSRVTRLMDHRCQCAPSDVDHIPCLRPGYFRASCVHKSDTLHHQKDRNSALLSDGYWQIVAPGLRLPRRRACRCMSCLVLRHVSRDGLPLHHSATGETGVKESKHVGGTFVTGNLLFTGDELGLSCVLWPSAAAVPDREPGRCSKCAQEGMAPAQHTSVRLLRRCVGRTTIWTAFDCGWALSVNERTDVGAGGAACR